MPQLTARRIHHDPVWMRVIDLLPACMRIGSRHNIHVHPAATVQQIAECIMVPEPRTALLQRNFGWVKRHYAARAQAGRIRMNAPEIVEPKRLIVVTGIVFYKSELRPSHGPAVPTALSVCSRY